MRALDCLVCIWKECSLGSYLLLLGIGLPWEGLSLQSQQDTRSQSIRIQKVKDIVNAVRSQAQKTPRAPELSTGESCALQASKQDTPDLEGNPFLFQYISSTLYWQGLTVCKGAIFAKPISIITEQLKKDGFGAEKQSIENQCRNSWTCYVGRNTKVLKFLPISNLHPISWLNSSYKILSGPAPTGVEAKKESPIF